MSRTNLFVVGKVCGCFTTTPCSPRENPWRETPKRLGRIPCLRSRHVLAGALKSQNTHEMPLKQENKKPYYRLKNRHSLNIRLNPEQESILEIRMRDGGWEKASSFVKYELGLVGEKEEIAEKIIGTKDPEKIIVLFRNEIIRLVEQTIYYNDLFVMIIKPIDENADIDVKKRISLISKMHRRTLSIHRELLHLVKRILKEIGDKECTLTSDLPEINNQNPTKNSLESVYEKILLNRKLK